MGFFKFCFSPIRCLKLSLSIVFLWFGFLKLAGVSPVLGVIAGAYPFIAESQFLYLALALLEIALGFGILIPLFSRLAAYAIIVHLLIATLGVLFSPQAFVGGFPMLTLAGEFVAKNFVLMAAAFVVARNGLE